MPAPLRQSSERRQYFESITQVELRTTGSLAYLNPFLLCTFNHIVLHLTTIMSDAPAFDQYGSLPGHLQNPAKQVMRFTGYFLDVESQEFLWTSYKEAIDNRPDVEMVIEQYDSNRVVSQEQTVEIMVNKIADCMMKIVSVVIGKEALAGALLDAYTSLAEKEDSGCACYNKDGSNTTFTYRLLLVGANPHVPDDFYAVVATIKMSADIQDKESWFGLDKSSSQNFSAEVNSLRLAVTKNFVAGPKPPM